MGYQIWGEALFTLCHCYKVVQGTPVASEPRLLPCMMSSLWQELRLSDVYFVVQAFTFTLQFLSISLPHIRQETASFR